MTTVDPSRFQVRISDHSYLEIVWARAHKNTDYNPCVAEFSADLYVDDFPICTMNKLSILNTTSRKTEESVLHIGSMSSVERRNQRDIRVFSITFFPGSREDASVDQERATFVKNCVDAVAAFIEHQNQKMAEKKEKAKPKPNPELDKLKKIGENVRSFYKN